MSIEVVGIGLSTIDYLMVIPFFPPEDMKMQALSCIKQGGGPVGTALVTLAKLGAKVAYMGKLGNDEVGRSVKESLQQYGVITDYIIEEKNVSSPIVFVLINKKNGKRTVIWERGTISYLYSGELNKKCITSAKFLHLDEYYLETALEAAKIARNAGVKVSLDADNVYPGTDKLISLTDILITSKNFPSNFLGEISLDKAIKELFKMGPEVVVITIGEEGCLCINKKGTFYQPAFKVNVVDTTGAGDAFHGAFLYGLLQKWDIKEIAKFSCAVAAINCTKLGGRSGLPTLEEVRKFMDNYKQ